jgi:hypothetical protein
MRKGGFVAKDGNLELVTWAREEDCAWDARTCTNTVRAGTWRCLLWTREHGCPWGTEGMCADAAWSGHLAVLQRVREHGSPLEPAVCDDAAQCGARMHS